MFITLEMLEKHCEILKQIPHFYGFPASSSAPAATAAVENLFSFIMKMHIQKLPSCVYDLSIKFSGIYSWYLFEHLQNKLISSKENYFVGCRSRSWNDSISFSFSIYEHI